MYLQQVKQITVQENLNANKRCKHYSVQQILLGVKEFGKKR